MSTRQNFAENWINHNRDVVKSYRAEWIAYNSDGIIAHGKELSEVTQYADKSKKEYILYLVPAFFGEVRFLPIRFRTIQGHNWVPEYQVILKYDKNENKTKMLVDSGSDFSLIPYKLGYELGLKITVAEHLLTAMGIGGSIQYVLRDITMVIDGYSFFAPVAWVQNKDCTDVILGREVVFDLFDVEFKQAEEKIIFRKRSKK